MFLMNKFSKNRQLVKAHSPLKMMSHHIMCGHNVAEAWPTIGKERKVFFVVDEIGRPRTT